MRLATLTSLDNSAVKVLGSTDDGWIHLQIFVSQLAATGVKASPQDASGWDQLVIEDVSGANTVKAVLLSHSDVL